MILNNSHNNDPITLSAKVNSIFYSVLNTFFGEFICFLGDLCGYFRWCKGCFRVV